MKIIILFLLTINVVWATCSSPISRTNFSANSILTSTALNTQFNDVFNKVNDLDGDCITAASIPYAALETGAIANSTINSESSTYTVATTDQVNLIDASGGAVTANLPTAVGNSGLILYFKKTDSSTNAVTLNANGSETIDGATSENLYAQYDSLKIVSDNSNWVILQNGITRRVQVKELSSAVTGTNSDITDLKFTGLVSGKWYTVTGFLKINYYGTGTASVSFTSGSNSESFSFRTSLGSTLLVQDRAVSWTFKADGTTLVVGYTDTASSQVNPGTILTLKEEKLIETTAW